MHLEEKILVPPRKGRVDLNPADKKLGLKLDVPPRKGRVDLNMVELVKKILGEGPAPQGAGGFKSLKYNTRSGKQQSRPARGGWI